MINPSNEKVYCGLDVSKKTLDAFAQGKFLRVENTPAGHRKLGKWIKKYSQPHVVCESTGGYERKVVRAMHQNQIPISVIMPSRPRQLARSLGWLAKTDRKDAELLALYGEKVPLKLTSPTSEIQRQLAENEYLYA